MREAEMAPFVLAAAPEFKAYTPGRNADTAGQLVDAT